MARPKRNTGCVQVDTTRNRSTFVIERTFRGNRFDTRFRNQVIAAVDNFTVTNVIERVGTNFLPFASTLATETSLEVTRKRRLLLEAMKGDVSDVCFTFQLKDSLIPDC